MATKKINFRMNTATEIRRTLQKVANMVANEEMDQKNANTIIYASNSALACLKYDEQDKRIDELELIVQQLK